MASGIDELDRVLGGGFVAGEVVLIEATRAWGNPRSSSRPWRA